MKYYATVIALLFGLFLRAVASPIPGTYLSEGLRRREYTKDADLTHRLPKRDLPSVAPSMPNPNSGIFDRSLTRVIQSQAKKPNHEFFENVHDGLLRAWRAQVEVRRYWEVVEDIKREQAIEVGGNMRKRETDQPLGSWPQEEKFQWRTNCEWLMNVSRRLTTVYKLPVPALSIFPDATSRYCIVK